MDKNRFNEQGMARGGIAFVLIAIGLFGLERLANIVIPAPSSEPAAIGIALTQENGGLDQRMSSLQREVERLHTDVAQLRLQAGNKTEEAPSADNSQVNESMVADQLALLEETVMHLAKRLEQDASVTAAESHIPSPVEIQQQREEERQQAKARYEKLMTAFAEEPIDTKWANETQVFLGEVLLQEKYANVDYIDWECRSSSCRFVIDIAGSQEDQDDFVFSLIPEVGAVLPQAISYREELAGGVIRSTLFFTRDGYQQRVLADLSN